MYLYDHGGITISTRPFSCGWDSGQIGFIGVSGETIKHENGDKELTVELRRHALKVLEVEVETYDHFLKGEAYLFVITERSTCPTCKRVDNDVTDSCGGFLGDWNPWRNGMIDHLSREDYALFEKLEPKPKEVKP